MDTMRAPKTGDTVYYRPASPSAPGNAEKPLPAIVVAAGVAAADLVVFGLGSLPATIKLAVDHIDAVAKDETGQPTVNCWEFPT